MCASWYLVTRVSQWNSLLELECELATAPHLIGYDADLNRLVIVLPREQQLRVARRFCQGPRLRRLRW